MFRGYRAYNRPEQLVKDFVIEKKTQSVSSRGRAQDKHDTEHPVHLEAILCGATPQQKYEYEQLGHHITHVISHRGEPEAKEGDRLVHDGTVFYIHGVDNPGDMGIWSLYYCEERKDKQDGE